MQFLTSWQGRTGRLPYLVALMISSATIVFLPFIASKIAISSAGGADPAMAILRSLIRPVIIGVGFLVAGVPLVVFARRRLRELDLSGVWLLLFPIAPLKALFFFAIAGTALGIWPLQIRSPVTGAPFWCEMAFGALLAVLPAGSYLDQGTNQSLRLAHVATACDGRLGRRTFALHLAIALGLLIIITVLSGFGLARGYARVGVQSVSTVASAVTLVSELLTLAVMMFLTASTIKRLHDLNHRGWWIVFFPLGLPSVLFLAVLAKPQIIPFMIFNPFTGLPIAQGMGCLILLALLLSKQGSDLDNPYGPIGQPVHAPTSPA